jgi:hypothetical protein
MASFIDGRGSIGAAPKDVEEWGIFTSWKAF